MSKEIRTKELIDLINTKSLKKDTYYKIVDYKPMWCGLNFTMMGHQFDITVKALDVNKIDSNVTFSKSNTDTYFRNNNLNKWQGTIEVEKSIEYTQIILCKVYNDKRCIAYIDANPVKPKIVLKDSNKSYFRYRLCLREENFPEYILSEDYPLNKNSNLYYEDYSPFDYTFLSIETYDRGIIITHLKDEFNNEADYDFKNLAYVRPQNYGSFFYTFSEKINVDESITGRYQSCHLLKNDIQEQLYGPQIIWAAEMNYSILMEEIIKNTTYLYSQDFKVICKNPDEYDTSAIDDFFENRIIEEKTSDKDTSAICQHDDPSYWENSKE